MTTSLVQGLEKVAALCKSANLAKFKSLVVADKARKLGKGATGNNMVAAPLRVDSAMGRTLPVRDAEGLSNIALRGKSNTVKWLENSAHREAENLWKLLQGEGWRFGKGGLQQVVGGKVISPTDVEAGLRHLIANNKSYAGYRNMLDLTKNAPDFKFSSLFADLDRLARRAAAAPSKGKAIARYQIPKSVDTSILTPEQLKYYNQYGVLPKGAKYNKLKQQIDAARPKQRPSKVNKKPGQAPETTPAPKGELTPPKGGADDALNKGDDVLENGDEVGEGFSAIAARHPWLAMGGAGVGGGALGYALAPSRSDIESEYAQRLAATQAPTAADVRSAYGVY